MKKGILVVTLILLLISLITADSDSSSTLEWKMFGRNLNNTRFYPDTVNITNMGVLWNFTTNGSINSMSSAIADDVLYIGSRDKKIYALNATTGQHIWNYTTGDRIDSSPAVSQGVVYIGSDDNRVYAINVTNGTQVWNFTTGGTISYSSPAVSSQAVFIGSSDYNLYALNFSDGTQLWNYTTSYAITSAPAVSNNYVYFGSGWSDNSVYAIDVFNGTHIWNYSTGGDVTASVAVADGRLFIGSIDTNFYALNASTGQHLWNFTTGDYIESSPAYTNGIVYVGSDDDLLYAINASTGAQVWNYTTTYDITSSPVISSNLLFVGTDVGLTAINLSNGAHMWNYSMSISSFNSPAIANGIVFMASSDQNIYAFSAGQDETPVLSLGSPDHNSLKNSTDPVDVSFNCYATDDQGIFNISLYLTNKTNQSFAINLSQSNVGRSINKTWTISMHNGTYTWACLAYDTVGQKIWSANRSLTVDGTLIEYFDLYGYTKYPNGSIINNTNVTVDVYFIVPGQGPVLNSSFSVLSNNTGYFNVSNIRIYNDAFYKPVVKHYNGSLVDYIGASLPEFPYFELENVAPVDFYVKQAATLNFSAVNASGSPIYFQYQIKDQKLGYSIQNNFNSYSLNVEVAVPNDRNYSIMIYPNGSFPVSADVTNLSNYYAKNFNCTESMERLTGYVTINNSAGFDSFSIVSYLLEPGRMMFFGDNAPAMFNFTADDFYNLSTGAFNISLVAPVENSTIILFAIVENSSEYYGGFQEVSLSYNTTPSEVNFTLYKLLGSNSNLTVNGQNGQQSIPLKQKEIIIYNSTGSFINDFAFVEIELSYNSYNQTNFTLMRDVSQNTNGTFSIPLLNISGIERINVYSSSGAPTKKSFTVFQLSSEVNLTLNDPFDVQDPDGDSLGDLYVDMISFSSECDIPNYNSSCSLFSAGETNKSHVKPLSVVMGGAPISFRMRNVDNITVHYVNVDLLASGPPDALFDSNSTNNNDTSYFAQAWRFGSSGPEIYDYVIIGAPYQEANVNQSGINESLQINITIPVLYDDDWNVIWNTSAGDNVTNISTDSSLNDYADYIGTEYESYFNSTVVVCNETNENLTDLCYKDTDQNMIWFKIPHFSGVGPEHIGVFQEIPASTTATSSGGGGGGGGFVPTTVDEEEVSQSKSWDVLSLDENTMHISKPEISVSKITFSASEEVLGAEITVRNLVEQPDIVADIGGAVYQYVEFELSDNINDSVISRADIEFQVSKNWVTANVVNTSTVTLYRWTGEWAKLETKQIKSNSTHLFYSAESPGFSYFVITGQRIDTSTVVVEAEASISIVQPEVKPIKEEPEATDSFPWLIFLIIFFVVVPGVGIGILFLVAREKKTAKSAQDEFIKQKKKFKEMVEKV